MKQLLGCQAMESTVDLIDLPESGHLRMDFDVQPPPAPNSSMNWQMQTDFSPLPTANLSPLGDQRTHVAERVSRSSTRVGSHLVTSPSTQSHTNALRSCDDVTILLVCADQSTPVMSLSWFVSRDTSSHVPTLRIRSVSSFGQTATTARQQTPPGQRGPRARAAR